MTKQKIEVGAIVKLKSGVPAMVVNEVKIDYTTQQPDGTFRCQWFAGEKLDSGIFPMATLEKVTHEKQ